MKYSDNEAGAKDLRQKAETLLKSKSVKTDRTLSESEMLKLIDELEVHQIEIEIQNEALIDAIWQADIAKNQADIAFWKFSELYDSAPLGFFTLAKNGEISSVNHYGVRDARKTVIAVKKYHVRILHIKSWQMTNCGKVSRCSNPSWTIFLVLYLGKTRDLFIWDVTRILLWVPD